MLKLSHRIVSLATLAAVVAVGSAAHAQPSVKVGDLNLATAGGKAVFAQRVHVAANQICGNERNFSIRNACETAVQDEAGEKAAAIAPASQFAALATVHSQSSIRISDLNLTNSAGQATFAQRVNVAAGQFCGGERNLTLQHACVTAVRAEVTEKLAMITPTTRLAAR